MNTKANSGTGISTGRGSTTDEDDEEEEAMYTFDDIKPYMRVYLNGREAWVVGKGEDVSSRSGRHLHLQFRNQRSSLRKESTIKDSLVNKYLRENRRLWVDWNGGLDPYAKE